MSFYLFNRTEKKGQESIPKSPIPMSATWNPVFLRV